MQLELLMGGRLCIPAAGKEEGPSGAPSSEQAGNPGDGSALTQKRGALCCSPSVNTDAVRAVLNGCLCSLKNAWRWLAAPADPCSSRAVVRGGRRSKWCWDGMRALQRGQPSWAAEPEVAGM